MVSQLLFIAKTEDRKSWIRLGAEWVLLTISLNRITLFQLAELAGADTEGNVGNKDTGLSQTSNCITKTDLK